MDMLYVNEINLFNQMTLLWAVMSTFKWVNWGTEELSDFPRMKQMVRDRAGI